MNHGEKLKLKYGENYFRELAKKRKKPYYHFANKENAKEANKKALQKRYAKKEVDKSAKENSG